MNCYFSSLVLLIAWMVQKFDCCGLITISAKIRTGKLSVVFEWDGRHGRSRRTDSSNMCSTLEQLSQNISELLPSIDLRRLASLEKS